jgi:exodeoxyribonuclease VII small subunit
VDDQELANLSYEQAFQALEKILSRIENESCTLEESMELFLQAQRLLQHCEKLLQEAELKVKQYVNGKWEDLSL